MKTAYINNVQFTEEKSAKLLRDNTSRIEALIRAEWRIWISHMVTNNAVAGPNFIGIKSLKQEWRDHIQPCQNPQFTRSTGN